MESGIDESTAQQIIDKQPESSIDNKIENGYNENRGEENGLLNQGGFRGNKREVKDEERHENTGADRKNARSWRESESTFTGRTQSNLQEAGQGRWLLLENNTELFAYKVKEADNTVASNAVSLLKKCGVNAVYCEGEMLSNKNGVTTAHREALTAPDGTVYVSSGASLSDIEIALHEVVHSNNVRKGLITH